MIEAVLFKFLKFALVGSSGMIIDFGTTYGMKEKVGVHPYLANSSGFSLAASSNYLLNRIWTFGSEDPGVMAEYASFFSIALIGLAINNLFLYLFDRFVFGTRVKYHFYMAKLCAIGVTIVWNFFANYYYTFV
ncbi:MAG: GtrA family protein [Flavobacteriales bacterium]